MFGALLCEHSAEVQSRIAKVFGDMNNDSSIEDSQKIEMQYEEDVQVIIKHSFIHAFQDTDQSTSRRPRSMSDFEVDYGLESLCSDSSTDYITLKESTLPVAEKVFDEDSERTLSTAPSTSSLGSRNLMEQELSEDTGSSRGSVGSSQYYGYNSNSMAHILRSYTAAMEDFPCPTAIFESNQASQVLAQDFQVTANLADHLERTAAKLREMAQAQEEAAKKENAGRFAKTEATAAAEKCQSKAMWVLSSSQSSLPVLQTASGKQ